MDLNQREREALLLACKALYFDDSADYGTYLWQIVAALDPSGADVADEGFDYLSARLKELEPDVFID